MEPQEDYLGGYSSSHLMMRGFMGYAIHVTNKRIIGVPNRSSMFAGMLTTSLVGGLASIGGKFTPKLPSIEGAKQIQELDERKEFEIQRDQVTSLELKRPGFFSRGHLLITPKSGRPIEIEIAPGGRDYEIIRNLVKAFYPEAVKTV
jgi:hypothetical protein